MNPWRPFPLIRLLIPILTGTATGLLIHKEIHVPFYITSVILLLLIGPVFIKSLTLFYKRRWLAGTLIFILLFLLSHENTIRNNDFFDQDYFMKNSMGSQFYMGDIAEPAIHKQKTTKTIVNVLAVYDGTWRYTNGLALIYFQKDTASDQLFYGDRILFRAEFIQPQSAAFPNSFDQKRFLNNQNIYYTTYINSGNWKTIPNRGKLNLLRIALLLRNRFLQLLRDNHMQGREFAVTAALLLGYVDEIDQGLLKDYSATGAMHILSVSGMHVGVIFLVLDKILGCLRKIKYGILIKTGLIILMIWFYAMLTGLSPAVLRASVMISLVAVGKAMKRQPDILNILSASFIILLINQPTLLFNVGFQLSYLAVAGIVLLYKPIYDQYITSNYLLDKIWSVVAVSIAAQIITFPLSLYYFHQFPNYFMITNVLVVPLSSLIIYTGISLLILSTVPFVSVCLAKILVALVWFLNHSIHFIEGMPFAVSKGVYLDIGQTVCIYLLMLSFFLFLFYKNRIFIFLLLLFSIGFTGSLILQRIQQLKSKKVIVYAAKNLAAFDFIDRQTSILLYDPNVRNNVYFDENHLATCYSMGIRNNLKIMQTYRNNNFPAFSYRDYFYKKDNFIQFNEKRFGFVNRKLPKAIKNRIHLDYLIITGNPKVTIEQIQKIFAAGEIIVDPTNSRWRSNEWKAEAAKMGVKIRIVNETGTYEIDF